MKFVCRKRRCAQTHTQFIFFNVTTSARLRPPLNCSGAVDAAKQPHPKCLRHIFYNVATTISTKKLNANVSANVCECGTHRNVGAVGPPTPAERFARSHRHLYAGLKSSLCHCVGVGVVFMDPTICSTCLWASISLPESESLCYRIIRSERVSTEYYILCVYIVS